MNIKDAIQYDVRQLINDIDEENWSDAQIIESLHFAIRRMRSRMQLANREFGNHIEVLGESDLTQVHGLYGWAIPEYMQRIQAVYTNDTLTDSIPYQKTRQWFDSENSWMIIPGYKRRLGLRYSRSELYIQYVPRLPALTWGTINGAPVGNTVELLPATGQRQSRYASAYKGWAFEICGDTDVAAGDVYQPMSSEFNPGASPTTTVTMDGLNTLNMVEDDEYSMLMPWDGLTDEALNTLCAYRLLIAEGHRRQASEIRGLLMLAEEELVDAGLLEGNSQDHVVEEVN